MFLNIIALSTTMHPLAHISYPALLFIILAEIFGVPYVSSDILLIVIFSVIIDFDFFYFIFVKNGNYKIALPHHAWFTHWPITYIPLLILLFFNPSRWLFLMTFSIYFHLAMDLFTGNGIMLFYPFSKKYHKFFSKELIKYDGLAWAKVYQRMTIFKVDVIAGITLIIFLFFKFAL